MPTVAPTRVVGSVAEDVRGGRVVLGTFGLRTERLTGAGGAGRTAGAGEAGEAAGAGELRGP
ncbi:hypothetical protein ACH4L7_22455 [Streptomyces anulatus]